MKRVRDLKIILMEKAVNFTYKLTYLKLSLLENSYQFFLAYVKID